VGVHVFNTGSRSPADQIRSFGIGARQEVEKRIGSPLGSHKFDLIWGFFQSIFAVSHVWRACCSAYLARIGNIQSTWPHIDLREYLHLPPLSLQGLVSTPLNYNCSRLANETINLRDVNISTSLYLEYFHSMWECVKFPAVSPLLSLKVSQTSFLHQYAFLVSCRNLRAIAVRQPYPDSFPGTVHSSPRSNWSGSSSHMDTIYVNRGRSMPNSF